MTDGIPEPELAAMLGITLDMLREKRGRRGIDWARQSGGVIFWTQAAAEELSAALGVAFVSTPHPQVLHVAQVLPGRLLCAKRAEELTRRDTWVTVRIPGNAASLFLPKMTISAMPGQCLSWRYLGPENHPPNAAALYPRRRGIW